MRQANQGTPRQEQNPTKAIVRYVNESDACDDRTPAPVRVALIPACEPGEHMVPVARALHGAGMEVVVVNDGSSAACDAAFQQVAGFATVLSHANNRGKGDALKTGLRYIQTTIGSDCVVVTVDADGQHAAGDVLHVCDVARQHPGTLTLGTRSFDGRVPLRSKLGNSLTRGVFRVASGVAVHDTQTGLRAFSGALIPRLLAIDGSRYEYETSVLLEFARDGVPLREVPIRTIYLDKNAASHFDPLRDSVRIYGRILRFSTSSLVSFGIDYLLFCLLLSMIGAATICNVCARVVSGAINFALNMEGATQMNTSMFANNPSASAGDVGSGTVGDTSGDAVEDDSANSGSSADESATSDHSASRKPSGKYERRSESSSSGSSDASTTGPLR